jgi:CDP-glycerol glycerophosphotransferase (TagB/SpsB family)
MVGNETYKTVRDAALNVVRKTPLREAWWKVKGVPPFAQVRHFLGRIHLRKINEEWYPDIYHRHSSEPVDPFKVVIIENAVSGLSNSFRLIYHDLKKDGRFTVHVHHLGKNLVRREQHDINGARLANDVGNAKYVFLSEACTVLNVLPIRPETTVVQLWHGCGAFKKFGRSTGNLLFGPSTEKFDRHPLYRHYNYVTVSSPEVVWAYEEAMGLAGQGIIIPIGVSRTDVFFDGKYLAKASERVYAKVPQARGKKVVLYAPTFRGKVALAETPDYKVFDLKRLREVLGEDTIILIKHHPVVKEMRIPKIPKKLEGSFAVDVSDSLTIEDLMITADVCITDYSSLIYEYSLLDKPLVFYAYDMDDYCDWRGFYYDYNEMTPGPVCRTMDELAHVMSLPDFGYDAEEMKAFREKFMSSCDGHATERIEKLVFGESLRG